MNNVFLLHGRRPPNDKNSVNLKDAISRIPPASLEPGIEVALTWLEQAERCTNRRLSIDKIAGSVLHMVNAQLLFVLESRDGDTRMVYSTVEFSESRRCAMCSEDGFLARLSRIRFTHAFDRQSPELQVDALQTNPAIENLMAVPLFEEGTPCGCLVAANRQDGDSFEQGDAMLLSLVAVILSIGKETDQLREMLLAKKRGLGTPTER